MPKAQLVVIINDDGTIGVNGPVDQTMLCVGMLEMAKVAILEHRNKAQKLIQEVPPGTVLRKMD